MKILFFCQFFTTGRTAGSMRPYRLCRLLAEKGHEVAVIATDFNFASGESEGPLYEEIRTRGKPLIIHRVSSSRDFRKSLYCRLKTYVGFAFRAMWKGLWISKDADIVLASIQPIFIGPIGNLVAAFRRIPFFLEIRDIWPDALEVKGAIKNRWILNILYAISRSLYRNACHIVSLTPGIAEELGKKGVPTNKIDVLPNGVDLSLFPRVNKGREEARRKLGWKNDFVCIYIGVHTEVTSMDTIVKAAEHLREVPKIRFEIFGNGSTTQLIENMIVGRRLGNCRLNGVVAKQDVPNLLAAADVCVMCLFESPLTHIYFENKFFDYMGAGKPIVAALRGHQRTIIESHETGICVDPFDSVGLADAVLKLSGNPALSSKMGENGRKYALEHFCLDDLLENYTKLLEVCARKEYPVNLRKEVPG